jgi:hypothetical protein
LLRLFTAGLIVLTCGVAAALAKENFEEGATWTGIMRTAQVSNKSKKTIRTESFDVKLVIKSIKEPGKTTTFTGEFYKQNDAHGLEVEGRVTSKGVISFAPTKEIKGSWANNVVGNWTFAAQLQNKGKQITGRATIMSTGNSYTHLSEYVLKAKE